MGKYLLVKTDKGVFLPVDDDLKNIQPGEVVEVDYSPAKQRTLKQNSSMHKYHSLLSTAFNDAGLTVAKTLSKPLNISWSPILVKELIWKPLQFSLVGKESTKDLETHEVSQVYEEINNFTASDKGIHVPFPNKDK